MDTELDLLLGSVIDSLAKMNLLVYLQENQGLAESPEELATRVHRPPEVVAQALIELAEAKLVARFPIGRGRLVRYGSSDDTHIRGILARLCERYREGGETRAETVRRALRLVEARNEDPARRV